VRDHLGVREAEAGAQREEALLLLLVGEHLGRRVERPYSAAEQAREVGRAAHEALERALREDQHHGLVAHELAAQEVEVPPRVVAEPLEARDDEDPRACLARLGRERRRAPVRRKALRLGVAQHRDLLGEPVGHLPHLGLGGEQREPGPRPRHHPQRHLAEADRVGPKRHGVSASCSRSGRIVGWTA
jgi:hypothetical protein